MRRTFFFLLVAAAAVFALTHRRMHQHDDDTYLEYLTNRVECADWQTYDNPDYGYSVRYPSCFIPAAAEEEGTARFAYVEEVTPLQNVTYMMLELSTERCTDSLHPYRDIRSKAESMKAICLKQSDDCYLMTGKMVSRDPKVTAYRFNAKYVLRQRLWFVQTFIYPEDFAPAVRRIVKEVHEWKPF